MQIFRKACLALLFFAVNAIIPDTKNDYKMVVTWGKPKQGYTGYVYNISWDQCLQQCWNEPTCVLIHDTSPTCHIYRIEGVTTVQKLQPNSDSKVAFRVLRRSGTCLDPKQDPLLNGGTIQSDVERDASYVNNQYIPYNITLENDVWTFSQRTLPFTCYTPTVPVRRGGMIWCMTVRPTGRCLDREQANADSMSQFQLPISGPANQAEYDFLSNSAMRILTNSTLGEIPEGYTSLGFWVDGLRKPRCTYPNQEASCSGTNEFDYADTNANPPTVTWLKNQPDGITSRTNAGCVYFIARTGNTIGMDDFVCNISLVSHMSLCMVGYYGGRVLGPDTWN